MKSTTKINKSERQKTVLQKAFIVALLLAGVNLSCEKNKDDAGLIEDIILSKDGTPENLLNLMDLAVEGGQDTLYVMGEDPVTVVFETKEPEPWIKVEKIEKVAGAAISRVILAVAPMREQFKTRNGVLNFKRETRYSGKFLRLTQGYETRLTEDFTWLRYATAHPMDYGRATGIGQWTTTQKQYGWSNPLSATLSATAGMNGYVLIGSDKLGGNLLSPIVPGIEKDSLLLLTFNATAFVSKSGEMDANKLTLKLNGAEFADSQTSKVLDLKHYDHESALIVNKMWEGTQYIFQLTLSRSLSVVD